MRLAAPAARQRATSAITSGAATAITHRSTDSPIAATDWCARRPWIESRRGFTGNTLPR